MWKGALLTALTGGAFAVSAAFADAKASHDYQCWLPERHLCGNYGGHPYPPHYGPPPFYGPGFEVPVPGYVRPYGRISCGEARRLVREHGYRRVRAVECRGRIYTFEALRRGKPVLISVNSRTGAVWRRA